MSSALYTALSALHAHQGWLDVIGNNLANTNTPGFKAASATFGEAFSRNLQPAMSSGSNPMQIGGGVAMGAISRDFRQGAISQTGRSFDLAIGGNGFFALSNGRSDLYTRVGNFGLDSTSSLVDMASGYRVLSGSGLAVTLDTTKPFAPSATQSVSLTGNLPAEVGGPFAAVLTGNTPFREGSSAILTGTETGTFTIPAGETWTMEVTVSGGAPQSIAIQGTGAPVTMQDVADAIDALDHVSASLNGGAIEVASDASGEDASLQFTPGEAGQDLAAACGLTTNLVTGSEGDVTPTTDLNALPGGIADYVTGDTISLSGVDVDGTAINASFVYGTDGTTVADLVSFIDGLYTGATAALDASGRLTLTADTPGETELSISISDGAENTGSTSWSDYLPMITTNGTDADRVVTSSEVFDSAGVSRQLTMSFVRDADGSWTLTAEADAEEGAVTSEPISGLTFDANGAPSNLAAQSASVTVDWTEGGSQTMALSLGTDGQLDGLTQFGDSTSARVSSQDGYGVGELADLSIEADGSVMGHYTNGQERALGSVGLAVFGNTEGLEAVGGNFWRETVSSGSANLGAGDSGSAGVVIGGALEESNVDTALEFVHLIEAQRGYQASSRVISVQDELLNDAVNLI
jgi:flagellar hook protein FlgE